MSKHYSSSRRKFLGQFSMGCASLGLSSLYSGVLNMGLINAASAANRPLFTTGGDYKALVCILLNGGNDSYNMLVPRGQSEYEEYASVRTNIALEKNQLLPIHPTNISGKEFGLHPELKNIQGLFNTGQAAFVANVGALVAPTTVASFKNKKDLPLGLFSHSDQQMHWQTSVPQDKYALGWGGRMADILHTNNTNQDISMNISLNGINLFQQGKFIKEYSISYQGSGSVKINGSSNTGFYQTVKRQTLDNLLEQNYNNILEKAYADSVNDSNANSISFSSAIENGTAFNTTFDTNSRFTQRLQMVAKTIAARDILGAKNQTFFIELGGFDNHDSFLVNHAALMLELDTALGQFFATLKELGVENQVTTFTMSDFARKLPTNGDGSDHGWGGHALVLGGAVKGQKIYGEYPDLYIDNSLDVGKGRLIPTISCDEYFAELALWFGASTSDLDLIFPNINNFWTPVAGSTPLGFMS